MAARLLHTLAAMKRATHLTTLLLLLATPLATTRAHADVPRLRRMVVVGDSLLAGFASGGFVGHGRMGQVNGAASLVARQAGVSLPLPLMSSPGVPPPLVIDDANRNGLLDPGEVRRKVDDIGMRSKPFRETRNLAIPGEDVSSVFDEIGPDDVARQLAGGDDVNGRDLLKFLILGLPPTTDSVSQVTRVRDLDPTFLLVWIGSNDVLGMATDTNPAGADESAAVFGQRFRRLLNALADTGADMAVANLPDVTGIAALRHAATEVTSCDAGGGVLAPVAADDLLSIDLARSSLPTPPCSKVLDATERAQVRATIVAFNAEIAAAIADTEQGRGVGIAPVDVFALFDQLRDAGTDLDGDGTPDATTAYLGGVFSLDGIHPTRTGHALIANAFIDAINARFGDGIAPVNVARVNAHDPLAHSRFRPAGEPPFGLIGDPDVDDIEGFFTKIYDRLSNQAKRFGEHLLDRITHWFDRLF